VTEWAPTKLALGTAPFYAIALLAAWLAGRAAGRLTRFEQAALLLTLVLALLAIRSVVWFMFAALLLLPAALDGVLSSHWKTPRFRHVNLALAVVAALAASTNLTIALAHPAAWYSRNSPKAAADTVARIAAREPGIRIFANERYADWLVWEHPRLAGRIAFDARFELLTAGELRRIVSFRGRIGEWQSAARGYGVLVLDPSSETDVAKRLASRSGAHVAFRDEHVIVIRRSAGKNP
jgi:hypothetical protein